ncbi:aldo/keto reductase [Algirhabdus cladophorae]|uniref:aldo/keto reductase n=1 Tax=Algirhabdus cladophorae TaxID=3377108 RepID=UPI003B84AB39
MIQRALGANGPQVSALGIGAMSFSNFYGPTDEAASHAILHRAMELGITQIDTANVYGMGASETAIGTFFKANPEAKDHFTLATKGAITRAPEGGNRFDNSFEHLSTALDESLTRLGVEAVDLYYVHRRDADVPIEEITGTMARLVEAGKIKSIGFSEIAPTTLRRAVSEHPIAAVQSEYSLQTRSPEQGLLQTCAHTGTAMVAFSPVGRGLLTDRPHSREAAATMPFLKDNPRFLEPNLSANIAATEPARRLAADHGTSLASLAIAWVLAQGDNIHAIPGTRSVAHLNELFDGVALSQNSALMAALETILPVGWCHGERYSAAQWVGPEKYC